MRSAFLATLTIIAACGPTIGDESIATGEPSGRSTSATTSATITATSTSTGVDSATGGSTSAGGGSTSTILTSDGNSSGEAEDCETFVGQATREQVATTPRPDVDAERLALELVPTVVAEPSLYDAITTDLEEIRTMEPAVEGISPRGPGRGLELLLDQDTAASVSSGTYDAWDCANALYNVVGIDARIDGAHLRMDGLFDHQSIALDYESLPGVQRVSPAWGTGGGTKDVCVEQIGDARLYIFHRFPNCQQPDFCTQDAYWGFTATDAGEVEALGLYDQDEDLAPGWFEDATTCRTNL